MNTRLEIHLTVKDVPRVHKSKQIMPVLLVDRPEGETALRIDVGQRNKASRVTADQVRAAAAFAVAVNAWADEINQLHQEDEAEAARVREFPPFVEKPPVLKHARF